MCLIWRRQYVWLDEGRSFDSRPAPLILAREQTGVQRPLSGRRQQPMIVMKYGMPKLSMLLLSMCLIPLLLTLWKMWPSLLFVLKEPRSKLTSVFSLGKKRGGAPYQTFHHVFRTVMLLLYFACMNYISYSWVAVLLVGATWVAQQSSIELELNFLNKIIAWEAFIWTCAWQFLYQLRVVARLYLNKNTREKWT